MLGRLVTLESCMNAMQATLVKNYLEAAGIRCVIADEHSVSNLWHLSNAIGGIKVQVAEEDVERASALLDELERKQNSSADDDDEPAEESPTAEAAETDGEEAVPVEPKPGEEEEDDEPKLNTREDTVERVYRTVLVGYMFPPLQFYALWLLADIWQSDLPLRPSIRSKLKWAVLLHVPMLLMALVSAFLFFRGFGSVDPWSGAW